MLDRTRIEKSEDGVRFLRLPDRMQEDLTFLDVAAHDGPTYYRLVISDGRDSMVYTNTCRIQAFSATRFKLFPDPVQDLVHITSHLPLTGCRYRIIAAEGHVVSAGSLPDGTNWAIDLTHLPAGYYLLDMTHRGGRITKPVSYTHLRAHET